MTINYSTAINEISKNGNWAPIGETVWHNPKDNGLYIGTKNAGFKGEEPTWTKKIADAGLFNRITEDLQAQSQQKGKGAGIYKTEDLYKALDKSVHDVFNVYASEYDPLLRKGETFRDINESLKRKGQGAA